ncbi:MAG: hypothetical protein L0Z53_07120, partial [Acidobacteriales bacterium]|nr:hypothetical protein [Terriglobales bacterium]
MSEVHQQPEFHLGCMEIIQQLSPVLVGERRYSLQLDNYLLETNEVHLVPGCPRNTRKTRTKIALPGDPPILRKLGLDVGVILFRVFAATCLSTSSPFVYFVCLVGTPVGRLKNKPFILEVLVGERRYSLQLDNYLLETN